MQTTNQHPSPARFHHVCIFPRFHERCRFLFIPSFFNCLSLSTSHFCYIYVHLRLKTGRFHWSRLHSDLSFPNIWSIKVICILLFDYDISEIQLLSILWKGGYYWSIDTNTIIVVENSRFLDKSEDTSCGNIRNSMMIFAHHHEENKFLTGPRFTKSWY